MECPDRVLIGGEESDEGRAAIQALVEVSSVFLMILMLMRVEVMVMLMVRILKPSRLLSDDADDVDNAGVQQVGAL